MMRRRMTNDDDDDQAVANRDDAEDQDQNCDKVSFQSMKLIVFFPGCYLYDIYMIS